MRKSCGVRVCVRGGTRARLACITAYSTFVGHNEQTDWINVHDGGAQARATALPRSARASVRARARVRFQARGARARACVRARGCRFATVNVGGIQLLRLPDDPPAIT
jgi:hypothetical protein